MRSIRFILILSGNPQQILIGFRCPAAVIVADQYIKMIETVKLKSFAYRSKSLSCKLMAEPIRSFQAHCILKEDVTSQALYVICNSFNLFVGLIGQIVESEALLFFGSKYWYYK